jgi:DNA-directed RNA polymerase subunit RPC12/RpoP
MAEYIECRKCDSPYCDGCNTLTLSKMLHARKFDCLLDEHHCINPCADVEPVKHGRWIPLEYDGYADGFPVYDLWECSQCQEEHSGDEDTLTPYCPHCGAKMEVDNG